MIMIDSAFFGDANAIARVYAQGRRERLQAHTQIYPHIVEAKTLADHLPRLAKTQVIFSTWGMPKLTPDQLTQLPQLQAVFYAAGSVQSFARPLLERNIMVSSAWRANGRPVAEFTVAQIVLSTKSVFRNMRQVRSREAWRNGFHGRGNFGATVALLGAGAIGRLVIELLKSYELRVIVFDPFLSDDHAAELGVEKVSLEDAFARGYVVSNHLANLPATVGMLRKDLFERMPENATFINTGRGATVDEAGMIEVLTRRPDLTALLDVTLPEPPAEGSPLYGLPNVYLTPHIAGSVGDEVIRMADYAIDEFRRWLNKEPLHHAVNMAMLETMA